MICNLFELKHLFGVNPMESDKNISIDRISTDTRYLNKNDVFLAIKGDNFNGHDFVEKAIKLGAIAIIVSDEFDTSKNSTSTFIKVNDTIIAYGDIARFYRLRNNYKVIAITGSSGKTTTKDMVASVLSEKYIVEKTYKNNNNEIGLPFTILNASEKTEVLVLEMGMRALGEIEYLTKIAMPNIGIITNIGIAHIGELGSQEKILEAKSELLKNLSISSIAIINGEDNFFNKLKADFSGNIKVFGFSQNASIEARNIKESNYNTTFDLIRDGKSDYIQLNLKGKHLLLDALIAIETGYLLNVNLEDSVKALNNLKVSPGRLELIENGDYLIINDTYNANPDSMKKSLDVLFSYSGNKIAVLGDMKELGENEIEYHKEIGRYLADKNLKALITVGELGKYIVLGLNELQFSDRQIYSFSNNIDAGKKLKELLTKNDIVLIKGSRVMEMEVIIDNLEEEVAK